MDWFNNMHFIRPEWLLALLPLLGLYFLLRRITSQYANWSKLIDAPLMPYLLTEKNPALSPWPLRILALTWLVATVALAGPSWQRLPSIVYEKDDVLIVLLDNTPSMLAADIKPSRIVHATREVEDLLQQRQEGKTGLITYSQDAFVVSPLTSDTDTIALLAKSLSPEIMPAIGNQPIRAFEQALSLLNNQQQPRILWITDEVPAADSKAIVAMVKANNINLAILGIGTSIGAPIPLPSGDGFIKDKQGKLVVPQLNRRELQHIATSVGGKYHDATLDDSDLRYLLSNRLIDGQSHAQQLSDQHYDTWRDEAWRLALLLLIPTLFSFRHSPLLMLAGLSLLPLFSPSQAQAYDWDKLWYNPSQQAQRAYQQQDYNTAAELFGRKQWRVTADDWYNKGNALAKAQQFEAAIKAYDEALTLDKHMEDAQFNKQLIERLLQQKQEQEEQNQDGEQSKDEQDKSSESSESNQDGGNSESPQEASENQQNDSGEQNGQQRPSPENNTTEQSSQENQQQPDADTEENKQQAQASDKTEKEAESMSVANDDSNEKNEDDSQPRAALAPALRAIKDNPGGLLRNKFQDQSQQRQRKDSTGEQRW